MSYPANQRKPKFLKDQIKEAERQVQKRQQVVDRRTTTLVQNIYQQLTDPSSLLLAGGIGFILGEITKRQPSKPGGADSKDNKDSGTGDSPLKVALNLMTSAQTLYTALPLAWMIKSRIRRPEAATEDANVKLQSVDTSGPTFNRRRSGI